MGSNAVMGMGNNSTTQNTATSRTINEHFDSCFMSEKKKKKQKQNDFAIGPGVVFSPPESRQRLQLISGSKYK